MDLICSRDGDKILDELVAPMRFMKIDEVEFVAMKACVLFNPGMEVHVLGSLQLNVAI